MIEDRNKWWYLKTYNDLVNKALKRGLDKKQLEGYYEKHHIVPRCVGGKDEDSNYVLFTFREHLISHKLLIRIYPDYKKELSLALYFMMNLDSSRTFSLKELEEIRKTSIDYLKEINSGKRNPRYGKRNTPEHNKKISEANKHPKSSETKEKLRKANLGKTHTTETKNLLSKIHTGKKIHTKERKDFLKQKWIEDNPNHKPVYDSNRNKFYKSLKYCAEDYNVSPQTIRRWIKNKPDKGISYC